ncbi:hypothetical protein C8R44DRAFT_973489, partial [Mycena epipterygia]
MYTSLEVAPPYSAIASVDLAESILHAIDGSQQQEFIKEIEELGKHVKSTIDSVEQIHGLLILDDAYVNVLHGSDPWAGGRKTNQEKYKKQIRLIKDAASKAKFDAIHPFVRIWSPMALDQQSDEDVLLEFEGFSENLSTIKAPVVDFDDMLSAIEFLKQDCDLKLEHAKVDNDEIKLLEDIDALEKKMKGASDQIEGLVPSFLKNLGLNADSHFFDVAPGVWPSVTGPRAGEFLVVRAFDSKKDDKRKEKRKQKSKSIQGHDFDALGEEITTLWSAADTVENCQNHLREKHKALDEAVYREEQLKSNQGR